MDSEAPPKRRRIQRSPSPVYKLDDEDDSYEPYVPVAQRRQAKLAKLASLGGSLDRDKAQLEQEERENEANEEERLKERQRKERTLLLEAQEVHSRKAAEGNWFLFLQVVQVDLSCRCEEDRGRKGQGGG